LHHGTQSQAKARFFGDATARENQKTAPTDFSCLSLGTETATIVDQTVTSRETNLVRRYKLGSVEPFSASYNDNLNKFRAEAAKGWTEFNPAYSYAGLKVVTHAGPLTLVVPPSQQAIQIDDFARCVRDDRPTRVPGEMGRRDMVIIEAIYASAAQGGKRVEIAV
jgi:predicted dehydrogenase